MSKKEWELNDSDARCPFFRDHTALTIACESAIPESQMRITFQTREAKKKQYGIFCCDHYECCENYRMVMDKYDG